MTGLWEKLKPTTKNPLSIFIYGLFSKWYLIIVSAALLVTFWVFKSLASIGLLSAFENTVKEALTDTYSIARYCTPKILQLEEFWKCIEHPPRKAFPPILSPEQQNLLQKIEKNMQDIKDPYEE